MSFFSLSPSHETLGVIFDIESTRVRSVLVLYREGKIPLILNIFTREIRETHKNARSGSYETILTALKEASQSLLKEGIQKLDPTVVHTHTISRIDYVLSSPWTLVHTNTVAKNFEEETIIRQHDITQILEDDKKHFEEKYKQGNFETTFEYDLAFIEEKIVDIRQNGYSVKELTQNPTLNLEVTFISGIASKKFLDAIKKTVKQYIHAHTEAIHSSLMLQYATLRSLYTDRDEYLWIHVHGGVTDVVGILRKIPVFTVSFPFGAKDFVDRVGKALKVPTHIADSLVALYESGNCSHGDYIKIEAGISWAKKDWFALLANELREMNQTNIIPSAIILWSNDFRAQFASTLTDENMPKSVTLRDRISLIDVDYSILDSHVAFYKMNQHSILVGMYAIAIHDSVLQ